MQFKNLAVRGTIILMTVGYLTSISVVAQTQFSSLDSIFIGLKSDFPTRKNSNSKRIIPYNPLFIPENSLGDKDKKHKVKRNADSFISSPDKFRNKNANEFINIYFDESIFRFSDYVKESKVSVFVVTGEFCGRCKPFIKLLKTELSKNKKLYSKVNVFLINIPYEGMGTLQDRYSSLGYQCFKNIDELSERQPTTIIFAPTKNQFAKILDTDHEAVMNIIMNLAEYCK